MPVGRRDHLTRQSGCCYQHSRRGLRPKLLGPMTSSLGRGRPSRCHPFSVANAGGGDNSAPLGSSVEDRQWPPFLPMLPADLLGSSSSADVLGAYLFVTRTAGITAMIIKTLAELQERASAVRASGPSTPHGISTAWGPPSRPPAPAGRAVSGHAFSCSTRKPQTGLASSTAGHRLASKRTPARLIPR